jgi:hypothetical protein
MFKFTAGHNFATTASKIVTIPGLTPEQINSSAFLWYLITQTPPLIYPIPGHGNNGNSIYRVFMLSNGSFDIRLAGGPGESYVEIRVFVIESSDSQTINARIQNQNVDISNYHEVAEYYGY